MRKLITGITVTGTCLLAIAASANTITFDTGVFSVGIETFHAEAVVTTSLNTLSITLRNLGANPLSFDGCISGLRVFLSRDNAGAGTLLSSAGLERTVNLDGTYSDGLVEPTGWVANLPAYGSVLDLSPLAPGGAGARHWILGAPDDGNLYSAAGFSIRGSAKANPFLVGDVTFTESIVGLNSADSATAVVFQFGPSNAQIDYGVFHFEVPDGASTGLLLGAALCGLGLVRRKLS